MNKHKQELYCLLQAEIDPAYLKRAKFIFDQVCEMESHSILDLGCGRGFYTNSLGHLPWVKRIVGLDVNAKYLELAAETKPNSKVKYIHQDFYGWKPKEKFDVIILSEVLEHVKDDYQALNRIKHWLQPEGKIIITVPHKQFPFNWDPVNFVLMKFGTHVRSDWWWLAGIWAGHNKLYSKDELQSVTQQAGLKIDKLQGQVRYCWPFTHFMLYGLGKNMIEKLGIDAVNRFKFEPSILAKTLAKIMRAPELVLSNLDETELKSQSDQINQKAVGLAGVFSIQNPA